MGQTTGYALPWPELVDSADGPDGFSDLATATENALKSRALRLVGAGKGETTSSVEVRATPYEPTYPIVLAKTARVVIVTVSVCICFAGATSGAFDLYANWDGVRQAWYIPGSFSDGNTDDRGYTFMFAVANQAQGNHTGTIGMFSGTGAVIHTKALMYNWVALG
jgi:hypothetical protein